MSLADKPCEDNRASAFPGPAIPIFDYDGLCGHKYIDGMSLREWFAGMAMQGILAARPPANVTYAITVKAAYLMADAMLEKSVS